MERVGIKSNSIRARFSPSDPTIQAGCGDAKMDGKYVLCGERIDRIFPDPQVLLLDIQPRPPRQ
jgi:hypothetical protein